MDPLLITATIFGAGLGAWNIARMLRARRSARRTRARVRAMMERTDLPPVNVFGVECWLARAGQLSTDADRGRFVYTSRVDEEPFAGWLHTVKHTSAGTVLVLESGVRQRFSPRKQVAVESRPPAQRHGSRPPHVASSRGSDTENIA